MIDVTKVEVNEDAKEVLITGVDLDSIWCFKDEPDETAGEIRTNKRFHGAGNISGAKNNKIAKAHQPRSGMILDRLTVFISAQDEA